MQQYQRRFLFSCQFPQDDGTHCEVLITVSEDDYGEGSVWYKIQYAFTYSDPEKTHSNPLSGTRFFDEIENGTIAITVKKTQLSKCLVKTLLKDFDDHVDDASMMQSTVEYKTAVVVALMQFAT